MSDVKTIGLTALVVMGGIGAISYFSDSPQLNIMDSSDSSDSSIPVYAHGVSASGVTGLTVEDEGSKQNKLYDVILPLSSVNGTASTLTVTINASQLFEDNQDIDKEGLKNHRFGLGFSKDVELEDSNGDEVKLIDFSDSLVNGEEEWANVGFLGSDSQTITYTLPVNPGANGNVYDVKQLEDAGDEYDVVLTTGFSTNIRVIFENDS